MTDAFEATPLPGSLDEEARRICHQLLCGRTELTDLPELAEDPALAAEVRARLHACGLEIAQARGWGRWVVTGAAELRDEAGGHGLNTPQLAALAYLFVTLDVAPAPSDETTTRLTVTDFTARFARPRGWKADFVRRAVLGPLESMEYIRVVTPGGERRQAYIQPGPRMSLLDRGRVLRRLERLLDAQDTARKDAA
jgi:hypothetical protein